MPEGGFKIASAYVDIKAQVDKAQFSRETKDVETEAGASGKRAGDNWSKSIKAGIASIAGGAVVATIKNVLGAASDLQESVSKNDVVFEESADAIHEWAGGAAEDMGLTTQAAESAAGGFGLLFTQLGFTEEQAAGMSQSMVGLAADLASFNNADITTVLEAQAAAFRGEYDSLQQFVPMINAANVEQKAMEQTGKASTSMLTDQEKALAVNALMFEQTGKAQGDFARTSDGAANSYRTMTAQLGDAAAEVGGAMLPAFVDLGEMVTDMVPTIVSIGTAFAGVLSAVISIVGPILSALTPVFDLIQAVSYVVSEVAGGISDFMGNLASEMGLVDTAPLKDFKEIMGETGDEAADTAPAVADTGAAINDTGQAAETQAANIDTFRKAVESLTGAAVGTLEANNDWYDSVQNLSESLNTNGATLDQTTEKGRANVEAVLELRDAAYASAEAKYAETGSWDDYVGVLHNSRQSLFETLTGMGLTETAAYDIMNAVLAIPTVQNTLTGVNDQSTPSLQNIQGQVNTLGDGVTVPVYANTSFFDTAMSAIQGGYYTATIHVQTVGAPGAGSPFPPGIGPNNADGGRISGVGGPRQDNLLSWVSNGEWVINAASSEKYGDEAMEAVNEGRAMISYADGGRVGNGASGSGVSSPVGYGGDTYNTFNVNLDVSKVRDIVEFAEMLTRLPAAMRAEATL